MEKNTNEILAQIQSELQELKKKAGEMESRISEIAGQADAEQSGPAEPAAPAGDCEPAETAAPAETVTEEAFDIMMGDEVDLIQPAGPVGKKAEEAVGTEPEPHASEPEKQQEAEPETKAEPRRRAESGKKVERTPEPGKEKEEGLQENLLMAGELLDNDAKPVKKTRKPSKPAPQPTMFYGWQTDTPASPLSNILSGIALKDRALIIGVLFQDDAQLFIDTVSKFNRMRSLNEAESFIRKKFPRWKLDSDPVYKLMMAVRRKLN